MHDFVRGIKVQDFVEGARFDPMLSLWAVLRSKKLNWTIDGRLGWYHYEFWTGVV